MLSPERWYLSTKLHGYASQKTEMKTTNLIICDVVTTVFGVKHPLCQSHKVKLLVKAKVKFNPVKKKTRLERVVDL